MKFCRQGRQCVSLSYHKLISDTVATLGYIPLSTFSRNSPQGIGLFYAVSFYEDPLGSEPMLREGPSSSGRRRKLGRHNQQHLRFSLYNSILSICRQLD